jgi:hypothetical protein
MPYFASEVAGAFVTQTPQAVDFRCTSTFTIRQAIVGPYIQKVLDKLGVL